MNVTGIDLDKVNAILDKSLIILVGAIAAIVLWQTLDLVKYWYYRRVMLSLAREAPNTLALQYARDLLEIVKDTLEYEREK